MSKKKNPIAEKFQQLLNDVADSDDDFFDESHDSAAENSTDSEPVYVHMLQSDYEMLLAKVQEVEEARQQTLRWQADFENFRRRTAKEREEFFIYAAEAIVAKMLPVLDNFDRAIKAAHQDPASLISGIEMIRKQQLELLYGEGLSVIDPLGELFDPNFHEAVMRSVATAEEEENTIVEVLQKGYRFKERLLRPALVKVAIKE